MKGKEVKEVLENRHFPLHRLWLFDAPEAGVVLTEFEDEPAIIHPLGTESFEDVQLAIFASSPEFTSEHWQQAASSGCDIIDLSYFLESQPNAMLRAPSIDNVRAESAWGIADRSPGHAGSGGAVSGASSKPIQIAVPAHPVSIAIAAILLQFSQLSPILRSVFMVFEPASERGNAGVDELHQQTVKLLAFQSFPRSVFDAQAAFNLLPSLGEAARPPLKEAACRIARHTEVLLGGRVGQPAVSLIQAPVFHGYSFACFVELKETHPVEAIEAVLDEAPLSLGGNSERQPDVVSVAGSDDIVLGDVEKDSATPGGYWIWGALDNLRIAAVNTAEIASQLLAARLGQPVARAEGESA